MKLALAVLFALGESLECNTVCADRAAYPSNATLTPQVATLAPNVSSGSRDLSETGNLEWFLID